MKLIEILENREKAKDIALAQKLRAKQANPIRSKTSKWGSGGDTTGGMVGYPSRNSAVASGGSY